GPSIAAGAAHRPEGWSIAVWAARRRGRRSIAAGGIPWGRSIAPRAIAAGGIAAGDRALPRGIAEGARIRLPGKAPGGGDIYVTLHIASHPVFEVDGYNLVRSVKVTPWQAVLGETVSVGTLDGNVDMKLPPGTQSGQKLRLRGKGLPKRNEGSGDLFVRIEVVIPRHLTEKQKKLWEELAEQEKQEKQEK
ncbi:MAG: hypothetical protein LBJ22_06220, partial [Synergistaceae bacterium]|nr:hypothetical protein [Synergistaceae bacterium]